MCAPPAYTSGAQPLRRQPAKDGGGARVQPPDQAADRIAQPTRGIDVGSIEFIHNQIVANAMKGIAVLVVSSELDEIMALSDRIVVMYKGEIIGIVPRAEATREGLGLLMAGIKA
jgi:ABC-type hemin transport system ATPase subunit